MPRQPMSSGKKKLILGVSCGATALAVTSIFLLTRPSEIKKLPLFPLESYMEGKELWAGELSRIEGRVENVIMPSANGNVILLSVHPKDSTYRVPIQVQKNSSNKKPIQREQQLLFKVRLGMDKEIQCTDYELQ